MWATSIGSTFSHSPLPGVRKSGIPDGTEIPAPVSATTRAGLPDQPRRARPRRAAPPTARADSLALPLRRRLPRKARIPSLPSSDWNAVANPFFSASIPSSRSGSSEASFTCSTAIGACAASLRAQASAVSNSSWSGTTRLASP